MAFLFFRLSKLGHAPGSKRGVMVSPCEGLQISIGPNGGDPNIKCYSMVALMVSTSRPTTNQPSITPWDRLANFVSRATGKI